MTSPPPELDSIRDALLGARSVLLTSHAHPDGDSLGSQLALGAALRQLGKQVRIIDCDPAPDLYTFLPDLGTIEIADNVTDRFDAVVVLECSSLDRTGLGGLDERPLINIDHHPGNVMYGTLNWHDESACACAELVSELIDTLGVPLTPAMATQLYVAILTDTGSFRHANITPRTFTICQKIATTGINPTDVASQVYNNGSLGRLRLTGMLLERMQLEHVSHLIPDVTVIHGNRVAVLRLNDAMLAEAGCTPDDIEGIVNIPLAARDVQAVVFFKDTGAAMRVSLRSKGSVDVRQVAVSFGGGGHRNAAGLTIEHPSSETDSLVLSRVAAAITDSEP